MPYRELRVALDRPVDAGSLGIFRIAFGIALSVLALRFFSHGWIESDYRMPHHFFSYWGCSAVRPWPGIGMYLHYAVMAASALAIAVGVAYRPACIVYAGTFTYAHLCDKSHYLNHYYLVSWITVLMVCMPLDRVMSLRVRLRPHDYAPSIRAWVLYVLRFQFAVVYIFGGIAKLGSDWLVYGEPLRIWLAANAEMPLVGRLFNHSGAAIAFSWCGMLFDLGIVPLLLWRKTQKPAYAVAVFFHVLTALLFKIGMFPWLMLIGATLFFAPSWASPWLTRMRSTHSSVVHSNTVLRPAGAPVSRMGTVVLALYAVFQLGMPLRHLLYPGNTLWSEEGFRYAWRIMLIEKAGTLELTVVDAKGRHTEVDPREYLTPFQARMAATQPDMVLELAHMVARDFDRRGVGPVQVYADARVSFNGRQSAPLIATTVDLAHVHDTLSPKTWILPAPTVAPEF